MDMKVFEKNYVPLLCGDCGYLTPYEDGKRTPEVSGFCEWMGRPVYRADFCHRPDQIAKHEEAKAAYFPHDCQRGERLYNRQAKLPSGK